MSVELKSFQHLDPNKKVSEILYPEGNVLNVNNMSAISLDGEKFTSWPECAVEYLRGYIWRILPGLTNSNKDYLTVPEDSKDHVLMLREYLEERQIPVPKESAIIGVPMEGDRSKMLPAIQENIKRDIFHSLDIRHLAPYLLSEDAFELSETSGLSTMRDNYVSTRISENKVMMMKVMKHFGVSVPRGETVYAVQNALDYYRKHFNGKKVLIKTPYFSSSHGMYEARSVEELEKILHLPKVFPFLIDGNNKENPVYVDNLTQKVIRREQIATEEIDSYLENPLGLRIEEWIEAEPHQNKLSMGGVIWIDKNPNNQKFLGLSRQVLVDEKEHDGNMHIAGDWYKEIEEAFQKCAQYLYEIGAYGINGIDFLLIIDPSTQKSQFKFMEFNPRATGQTHLNNLSHNLFGSAYPEKLCWAGKNIKLFQRDFQKYLLDIADQEFSFDSQKRSGFGILPYNWLDDPNMDHGKAMIFAVAQTKEKLDELLKIAEEAGK